MYTTLTKCRACGSKDLAMVFSLGVQALANDFCLPHEPRAGYAPLEVMFCQQCTLAQLSVVVDPSLLYRHYRYITSNSQTMHHHFATLCHDLLGQLNGVKEPILLEIGSNNGDFLDFSKMWGFYNSIGIDPAENLANRNTVQGLFNAQTAHEAWKLLSRNPDVIVARHVFCHVDDWQEFILNLKSLCHENTVIAIEVPYVGDLLERVEFDSIYHEHTSYMSIRAMIELLKDSGLGLMEVKRYSIHGGSICMIIRLGESTVNPDNITKNDWEKFNHESSRKIVQISTEIRNLKLTGKVVGAFGASAKASVLINASKYDRSYIAFVSDNTPHKIGRLIPGTDIPVIDERDILDYKPDYLLLTAWNFEREILEKMKDWRAAGGKFIIPYPEVRIV